MLWLTFFSVAYQSCCRQVIMISELLFLVSIVDAAVVSHIVSPQRGDTLCQHQRCGTMQSSTSALYSPSQDFLDGFRSHGIKRNTYTSRKHVRVLPQKNMLEAVITAFHCRRKPSFVAPTVFVSTHRTKRRPTCLSYCKRQCYLLLFTAFG